MYLVPTASIYAFSITNCFNMIKKLSSERKFYRLLQTETGVEFWHGGPRNYHKVTTIKGNSWVKSWIKSIFHGVYSNNGTEYGHFILMYRKAQ